MPMRPTLILGTAALIAAAGYTLALASIRSASITHISAGSPAYASLVWHYGPGRRPRSLILDVSAPGNVAGSLTTDDAELESGTIPFAAPFSGPYTITITATYRLIGFPYTCILTFSSRI